MWRGICQVGMGGGGRKPHTVLLGLHPLGAPSQSLLPSHWPGWAVGELPLNSLAQAGAHTSCFKFMPPSWGLSGYFDAARLLGN